MMTPAATARPYGLFAAVLIAAVAAGLAGCTNSGSSGGQTSGARPPASAGQNARIPDNARVIGRASGTRLVHRTMRDGTIYVQDKTSGRLVHTGPVRSNDNVVVDPKADAIAINDNQVKGDPKLDPHHTYLLYFVQR